MHQYSPHCKKQSTALFLAIILVIALFAPVYAFAQEQNVIDIISASAEESAAVSEDSHTHPPLRLTPDKSEIINLPREAASIIIGNPNHLGILADSSKRIILVPRAPGASYFSILDKDGGVIMQRHAVIASPKKKYIRVRRACANDESGNCQETRVFYCPDMCHEIMMDAESETGGSSSAAEPAQGGQTTTEAPDDEEGSE